jgi:threonyl-tRNA synthetase
VNVRGDKIGAKIRNAQLQKIPFMLVLGDREMEEGKVAVRERSKGDIGEMSLDEFKEAALKMVGTRELNNMRLDELVSQRRIREGLRSLENS